MITPIKITIKGFPKNDIEDLDIRNFIPIRININDYPVFHYFGKDNPLIFDILYKYKALAKMKLNVKSDNPAKSSFVFLDCYGTARLLIKGDFNYIIFGIENRLKATSNYFARNGFIKNSQALAPEIKANVLVPVKNMTSSISTTFEISDCYQIRSNLLLNWDEIILSEMDEKSNENIAGTII